MKVAPVDIYEAHVPPAEAAARHVATARHLLAELHNRLGSTAEGRSFGQEKVNGQEDHIPFRGA